MFSLHHGGVPVASQQILLKVAALLGLPPLYGEATPGKTWQGIWVPEASSSGLVVKILVILLCRLEVAAELLCPASPSKVVLHLPSEAGRETVLPTATRAPSPTLGISNALKKAQTKGTEI